MMELEFFATLGLGGIGVGLLIAFLGDLTFGSKPRAEVSDATAQTYMIHADFPTLATLPPTSQTVQKEELVKCPCGLELTEAAMRDHVTVSGHSKSASAHAGGGGKVWDLNEAVVESASPDCYKCGKPVHGLKRMGKTIYVAHLGCTDKTKPTPDADKIDRTPTSPKVETIPRSHRCPICRKVVAREEEFTEMRSRTGRLTHFHSSCFESINGPVQLTDHPN